MNSDKIRVMNSFKRIRPKYRLLWTLIFSARKLKEPYCTDLKEIALCEFGKLILKITNSLYRLSNEIRT